jgi:hypothetical protein
MAGGKVPGLKIFSEGNPPDSQDRDNDPKKKDGD